MLHKNDQLFLAPGSIKTVLTPDRNSDQTLSDPKHLKFSDTAAPPSSKDQASRRRSTFEDKPCLPPSTSDDKSFYNRAAGSRANPSDFMLTTLDIDVEDEQHDYYTSSLLRPNNAADECVSSSPVSATTLGAVSLDSASSVASPRIPESATLSAGPSEDSTLKHPNAQSQPAAATTAAPLGPLGLRRSLASLPGADLRQGHSSTAPITARPTSYFSTRSSAYSGDLATWESPSLTNGSSIASSRPTSSAFLTDTDASNRASIVESYSSGPSVDSPVLDTAACKTTNLTSLATTEKTSAPIHTTLTHSDSHASSLEVLTAHSHLSLPEDDPDDLPSPSRIGLGLTTEEEEDDMPAPLRHHTSDTNLNGRTPSLLGRQRSQGFNRAPSRSSSVAERIERVRLSALSASFSDRSRDQDFQSISGHRASGLRDVSSETTRWCLRGNAAEQVVAALNSVMGHSKLTHLDISHCGLTELPLSIQSFTSLKVLDISNNKLSRKSLPAFLASLTSLEKLVADCCDLHSLHHPLSSLTLLETLSLQNNQLKSLPSWFSHLEHLTALRLDGNPLHGVFADLARPLCQNRATANRSRVSSVASLTQSMFQSQSSQPPSAQVSPVCSPNDTRPIGSASAFFRHTKDSSFDSYTGVPNLPVMRPTTSHGTPTGTASHKQIRKMKSSNDIRSTSPSPLGLQLDRQVHRNNSNPDFPSPVRPSFSTAESAMATPQSVSSSQILSSSSSSLPTTPPLPTPSAVKKKSSFFKKMGSFGRSRRDSNKSRGPEVRTPGSMEEDTPPPLPEKPDLSALRSPLPTPPQSRPASITQSSRPQSATSVASSFGQLRLEQTPSKQMRSGTVAVNDDDSEAEEIFDQSFNNISQGPSSEQERASALQALQAYLGDLDDLMPRDALPLHSGSLSRSNTHFPGSPLMTPESPSPANTQPSAKPLKLKVDLAKRESVINEIVATERSYVTGLKELVDIYVVPSAQPVKSGSSVSKESIIPLAERKSVFSNIENLLEFHKSAFLPDLEKAIAPLKGQRRSNPPDSVENHELLTSVAEALARVFVRHGAFLKMYHIYVNNFDSALSRFQSWSSSSSSSGPSLVGTSKLVTAGAIAATPSGLAATDLPIAPVVSLSSSQKKRVKVFLNKCRTDPRHTQMNCESYLLMPVQRIPRYRMLLEQLVSCTPMQQKTGDSDLQTNPVLSAALGVASDLANELNEKKRESEGRTRLLYWQARIGNKFRSPLVQPHRLLLKETKMTISRTVKRSTDLVPLSTPDSISGQAQSVFQFESLKVENEHRPLIALLSSDILVLVIDSGYNTGPVELYSVVRLGRTANSQCATTSGKDGSTLRVVDPQRAILYLETESAAEANAWANAINQQAIAF